MKRKWHSEAESLADARRREAPTILVGLSTFSHPRICITRHSGVRYPLGKPGFRKTIEGRAETDFLVAQIQALMLAMSAESPRGPPEAKGKGSPRAHRTR
jgi:hypothetical protein